MMFRCMRLLALGTLLAVFAGVGVCQQETPAPSVSCQPQYSGDGYCDKATNNNVECGYDSGDCCECDCVSQDYPQDCLDFDCIDPDSECFGDTPSPVVMTESTADTPSPVVMTKSTADTPSPVVMTKSTADTPSPTLAMVIDADSSASPLLFAPRMTTMLGLVACLALL